MNRTLLLGAAWTASAGAAVGLGFLAVSLVDASASPAVQPVATSSLDGAESTASSTPPVSPAPTGQQVTPGGTVFASCAAGSPVPVLSGAPAPGWWPDDDQDPGEFEFESATQKVEVHVTCVDGVPRFFVEGPRPDDNGRHDDDGTPAATPSTDAPDDSDGRGGGGHGSDDGPGHDAGDDHGGGSNSGSGSDSSGSGDSGSGDSGPGGHGSDD